MKRQDREHLSAGDILLLMLKNGWECINDKEDESRKILKIHCFQFAAPASWFTAEHLIEVIQKRGNNASGKYRVNGIDVPEYL